MIVEYSSIKDQEVLGPISFGIFEIVHIGISPRSGPMVEQNLVRRVYFYDFFVIISDRVSKSSFSGEILNFWVCMEVKHQFNQLGAFLDDSPLEHSFAHEVDLMDQQVVLVDELDTSLDVQLPSVDEELFRVAVEVWLDVDRQTESFGQRNLVSSQVDRESDEQFAHFFQFLFAVYVVVFHCHFFEVACL